MVNTNPLVGKVVTAIYLSDDDKAIRFDVANGESIIARCDGDCCSVTWVANIENVESVIDSEIFVACDIPMPDLGEMPGRDVVAYYGFKIETLKGTCTIDYRNESNGYYGGSLVWDDSDFYGGVYGQNVSNEKWVKQ